MKTKKAEVRKATTTDLRALAALFDNYRVFYNKPSDIKGAEKFLFERITKNESEIFISCRGNTLTGFVQLYPLFSSTRMKRLWLLNELFVHEYFRGQGFSIALIERAKELCHQSTACGFMLETTKTNAPANQLYQKADLEMDTDHNFYNWETHEND
jgi:GNAT superfamily N-acetyltransferase